MSGRDRSAAPRLRRDLNDGTLWNLPTWSTGYAPDLAGRLDKVKEAGYEAVQSWWPEQVLEAGLLATAMGRVNRPEEAEPLTARHKALGCEATTLHVGNGFETDFEIDQLVGAVIEAAVKHKYPLYIETHRATITQDMRRTLDMIERFPAVRFNADLSHWYTGHEFTYGDVTAKLERLSPVFERVRFMHGRISTSGSIQVSVDAGTGPHIEHFRDMWTRCFTGFLCTAEHGDILSFNPELLPGWVEFNGNKRWLNYAELSQQGEESTDRFSQANSLFELASDLFEAARANERAREGSLLS